MNQTTQAGWTLRMPGVMDVFSPAPLSVLATYSGTLIIETYHAPLYAQREGLPDYCDDPFLTVQEGDGRRYAN
jgi:hypothetical protein